MKKFISALSSFVIAATAMGGAMVHAATNTKVDKSIIEITTGDDKKTSINLAVGADGKTAEAQEIPVSLYIPQSAGIRDLYLVMKINDGEPGAGTYKDRDGKEHSYDANDEVFKQKLTRGNYGFTIKESNSQIGRNWSKSTICFDSGYTCQDDDPPGTPGKANNSGASIAAANSWVVSYNGGKAMTKKMNMDSYCAWAAAGKPAYAGYTPVTTWTEDEKWSRDNAFFSFTLVAPAGLEKGVYTVNLDTKDDSAKIYNLNPSALFDQSGKLKEPTEVYSTVSNTDAAETPISDSNFEVRSLKIVVGDATPDETDAPPAQTEPPKQTEAPQTEPPKETQAPAEGGSKIEPKINAGSAKDVTFDIVLHGETPIDSKADDSSYNAANVKPNDTVTFDWVVTNDPGTAGLQVKLDFTPLKKAGFTYVSSKIGDAYDAEEPIKINDTIEKDGIFQYGFGLPYEMEPVTGTKTVYSFTFKAPAAAAVSDVVTLKTPKDAEDLVIKAIPETQGKVHTTVFHGVKVAVVGETPAETEPPKQTEAPQTEAPQTEAPPQTQAPVATTAAPVATTAAPAGSKLLGDTNVDGSVLINDVVLLNRYLAGTKTLEGMGLTNADANVDGKVDPDDATEIKEFLARLNLATTKVNTAG